MDFYELFICSLAKNFILITLLNFTFFTRSTFYHVYGLLSEIKNILSYLILSYLILSYLILSYKSGCLMDPSTLCSARMVLLRHYYIYIYVTHDCNALINMWERREKYGFLYYTVWIKSMSWCNLHKSFCWAKAGSKATWMKICWYCMNL